MFSFLKIVGSRSKKDTANSSSSELGRGIFPFVAVFFKTTRSLSQLDVLRGEMTREQLMLEKERQALDGEKAQNRGLLDQVSILQDEIHALREVQHGHAVELAASHTEKERLLALLGR